MCLKPSLGIATVLLALASAAAIAQPPGKPFGVQPGMKGFPEGKPFPPPARLEFQWIDVHVHLIAAQGFYDRAAKDALAAMEEAGIKRMVIMPTPQPGSGRALFDSQNYLTAVRRAGGQLAFLGGGGSLNSLIHQNPDPAKVDEALRRKFEETAERILKDGAAGFGEIAAHHLSAMPDHPYESVPADHPLLLLLADITARNDVVIDLHFDPVAREVPAPERLPGGVNPPLLAPNLPAFERMLAHNRKAKVIWAHAGSDMIGHWSADLSRELLRKHPNLYMSLRFGGGVPANLVLRPSQQISPQWLVVFEEFPDRFVIGGDQFFADVKGGGPAVTFASRAAMIRQRTLRFLSLLPPALARKIGYENAERLYKLK